MTESGRHIPLAAIRDAASKVYSAAIRTPLIRIALDPDDRGDKDTSGASHTFARPASVYLKLEVLQPIGSFKIRGAYNAIRQLLPDDLREGVWTVSAGNAAQGVALAARKVGARCSVMVMDTAPDTKIRSIERLGASIVRASYDECWRTVEAHGSDRMTGHFVHPFDDDRFIAGNATIGLEILEDLPEVEAIVAPLGGGGLLSGISAAVNALRPTTRIYAAEPETAAPLSASLAANRPIYFDDWKASFVDGAGGKSVLPTMWPMLSSLTGSIVVTLDEVAKAMKIVADRAHVIAEGAAGCAVAAALSGRAGSGNVVAVVSGGNIDLHKFAALVGAC
ncbi:MAG TPA: pyridoxal-phosphate dependent enzyme [Vicinamibacterales bacterium]|jgi:threonine dehydratase|nr:pyridoxal-phosphate dependent enzyme [Vicinamibacterales bacterium]